MTVTDAYNKNYNGGFKMMTLDKKIELYELLRDYEEEVKEIKKSEYDSNVIYFIQKEINAIDNICMTLSLDF